MTWLESIVTYTGKAVAWLTLLMVMLTVGIVVMRYGFNLGWIWLQESVTYLHAAVFMIAAAWTLQEDGHVRVDIFYRSRSRRHQAMVDLIGIILFLLPTCIFLLFIGWDYVFSSWKLQERSREAGGLPLVYLLKTLILLMPGLLMMQAVPLLFRSVQVLRGKPDTQTAGTVLE